MSTLNIRSNGERLYLLRLVRADKRRLERSFNPTLLALERSIHLERELSKPYKL